MSDNSVEYKYHWLCGLLITLLFFFVFNFIIDYKLIFYGSVKELLSSATVISSIGVGFLATTKAILISIKNSKTMKWLKDGGHYLTIVDHCMCSIHWCFAFAIYSSMCLFLNYDNPTYFHFVAIVLWIFLASTAFSSSYRIIKLFSTILKNEAA